MRADGRVARAELWRIGLAVGTIAFGLNALIYMLGVATGVFSGFALLRARPEEVTLLPILLVTFGAAIAGTSFYGAIRERVERPFRRFALLSVLLLTFSFGAPVGMGWIASQAAVLNLMHVVVALLVVSAVWQWERELAL